MKKTMAMMVVLALMVGILLTVGTAVSAATTVVAGFTGVGGSGGLVLSDGNYKTGYIANQGHGLVTASVDGTHQNELIWTVASYTCNSVSTSVPAICTWDGVPYSTNGYFEMKVDAGGFTGLAVSAKLGGNALGPRQYKMLYSLDGVKYTDVGRVGTITAANVMQQLFNGVALPPETDGAHTLYIRLQFASQIMINGSIGLNGSIDSIGAVTDFIVTGTGSYLPYVRGDANENGTVETGDARQVLVNVSTGNTDVDMFLEDVDRDNRLSSADARLILMRTVGQIDDNYGYKAYPDATKLSEVWDDAYADADSGFVDLSAVTGMSYYANGAVSNPYPSPMENDVKKIFKNAAGKARVVNCADGYALTLPSNSFMPDYSLSGLRSRYEGSDYVLNVSYEDKNPYGNIPHGWNVYLTEWLNRYIANADFLDANGLSYTRTNTNSTTMLPGYTVMTYDIVIDNKAGVDYPYYNIGIIRRDNVFNECYLLVMKSTSQQNARFDAVLRSFAEVTRQGTAVNAQQPIAVTQPNNWSAETKSYYKQFCAQDTTSWGVFSASMVPRSSGYYSSQRSTISSEKNRLESSSGLNYNYDIIPTYTHLGDGFPSEMAAEFAGGNGTNGKPVLQFTYQFTTSNNTNLGGYTPIYDVLNGVYDGDFRALAQAIKSYQKPVLFRLNNEMNTDWTSYCGMVSLLDPDLFTAGWKHLYEVFRQQGVNNCIWIFNPVAVSTPYSKWGEDLCYMPGGDYIQALGLTGYEMNNENIAPTSFEKMYSQLGAKNTPYFDDMPWVISEFACGAGGERKYSYGSAQWESTVLGRNAAWQAQWVNGMFTCLQNRDQERYAFCRNIKGAVWFSVNDYADINGRSYITNYLTLESSLTATLAAFRNGLAAQ